MSAGEFKPGDVAMVTHDGEDLVAVRGHSLWADRWFIGGPSRGSQHGWTDASLDAVRPLVVIDPEDREQAKRLMSIFHALGEHKGTTFVDRWQDALREFAKPTPPRCKAALLIKGEHFRCDMAEGHGMTHGNTGAEAIWGVS